MNRRRGKRWLGLLRQPRRLIGRLTGPKVLVVSVPKSGTHLLVRTLGLFPQLVDTGTMAGLPLDTQVERVARLRPGKLVSTHRPVEPALDSVIYQYNIRVVFISRDPRDVCVSLYHYMERQPKMGPVHSYCLGLPNADARLMMTITGVTESLPDGQEVYWESVDTLFRRRLGWLTHPRCCAVTFEELVGPQGGGDADRQRAAIRRIARHIGVSLTQKDVEYITQGAFSTRTGTFRRGQIGGWRQEMTAAHQATFKEVAGPLLIELGYETDMKW